MDFATLFLLSIYLVAAALTGYFVALGIGFLSVILIKKLLGE